MTPSTPAAETTPRLSAAAPTMTPGHCTACGGAAEQAPSGNWWHISEPCWNRSSTAFPVVDVFPVDDGVAFGFGILAASEGPARFVAA